MTKRRYRLSGTDKDVLKALWDAEKPLSVVGVCEFAYNSIEIELDQVAVQSSVNKLARMGLLRVEELTREVQSIQAQAITRLFTPVVSRVEFLMLQLGQVMQRYGGENEGIDFAALKRKNAKNSPNITEGD